MTRIFVAPFRRAQLKIDLKKRSLKRTYLFTKSIILHLLTDSLSSFTLSMTFSSTKTSHYMFPTVIKYDFLHFILLFFSPGGTEILCKQQAVQPGFEVHLLHQSFVVFCPPFV